MARDGRVPGNLGEADVKVLDTTLGSFALCPLALAITPQAVIGCAAFRSFPAQTRR